MSERKFVIKNIFWDVDGVLANLNHAYYCFIKNHPKFKEYFKKYEYKDLPDALPVDKNFGAMELKTHPTLGVELDKEFCTSEDYYFDRPLYHGTAKILKELNDMGYLQMTMSAGFNIDKKKELLKRVLGDLTDFLKIEVVEHDKAGMEQGSSKESKMLAVLKKLGAKPEETVLVDDRIYNIYSAIKAGVHPVRFRSEFTTDSPADLKDVPEVDNIYQFKDWLLNNTTRG